MRKFLLLTAFFMASSMLFAKKPCWRMAGSDGIPNSNGEMGYANVTQTDCTIEGVASWCINCWGGGDKLCPKCPPQLAAGYTVFESVCIETMFNTGAQIVANGTPIGNQQSTFQNTATGETLILIVSWHTTTTGVVYKVEFVE